MKMDKYTKRTSKIAIISIIRLADVPRYVWMEGLASSRNNPKCKISMKNVVRCNKDKDLNCWAD